VGGVIRSSRDCTVYRLAALGNGTSVTAWERRRVNGALKKGHKLVSTSEGAIITSYKVHSKRGSKIEKAG